MEKEKDGVCRADADTFPTGESEVKNHAPPAMLLPFLPKTMPITDDVHGIG